MPATKPAADFFLRPVVTTASRASPFSRGPAQGLVESLMTFSGFDRGALSLLPALPSFDAEAYREQRDKLVSGLTRPAAALIREVASSLAVPLSVSARNSVSPLHTDLRFAPPGAPRYKDHLLLTAWHGPDKKNGPTLWIRVDAKSVGFASGVAFSPAVRERWRAAVAGTRGGPLSRILNDLARSHAADQFEIAGERLQKVPAPWPADHPRADLLRRTAFQARFRARLPADAYKPSFVAWCGERLRDLVPLHCWLVSELFERSVR